MTRIFFLRQIRGVIEELPFIGESIKPAESSKDPHVSNMAQSSTTALKENYLHLFIEKLRLFVNHLYLGVTWCKAILQTLFSFYKITRFTGSHRDRIGSWSSHTAELFLGKVRQHGLLAFLNLQMPLPINAIGPLDCRERFNKKKPNLMANDTQTTSKVV